MSFGQVFGAIVAGLSATLILWVALSFMFGPYTAKDVAEVCDTRGGVADVESLWWDLSIAGEAMVVCKDGHVGTVDE